MDISLLSSRYCVKRLTREDVPRIYALSCGNTLFYKHHPPFVTEESICDDMDALPPGKGYEDKFYIGFFDGDDLVAVMDLIRDYPEKQIAFIGLFMVDAQFQGKGVGTKIIQKCIQRFRILGFESVRLGVDIGNPQSFAFWRKNGFSVLSEDAYILMELQL